MLAWLVSSRPQHAQVPVRGVLVVQRDLGHHGVDGDGAGVDGFEAIDGAAQSRLTGARRTEDDHHLALGYLEIDLLQDVKFPEVFVHQGHRNHGCGIAGGGRRRRIVGLGHKREP